MEAFKDKLRFWIIFGGILLAAALVYFYMEKSRVPKEPAGVLVYKEEPYVTGIAEPEDIAVPAFVEGNTLS